jgi:hypothetical protein
MELTDKKIHLLAQLSGTAAYMLSVRVPISAHLQELGLHTVSRGQVPVAPADDSGN